MLPHLHSQKKTQEDQQHRLVYEVDPEGTAPTPKQSSRIGEGIQLLEKSQSRRTVEDMAERHTDEDDAEPGEEGEVVERRCRRCGRCEGVEGDDEETEECVPFFQWSEEGQQERREADEMQHAEADVHVACKKLCDKGNHHAASEDEEAAAEVFSINRCRDAALPRLRDAPTGRLSRTPRGVPRN